MGKGNNIKFESVGVLLKLIKKGLRSSAKEEGGAVAVIFVTFARLATFAHLSPTSAQFCHSTSNYSTSTSFSTASRRLRLENTLRFFLV